MNDTGTGKINKLKTTQPASAPYPSCLNGIDNQTDDCGVETIGGKLCPLRHCTGNNRGCRCTEDQLEHKRGPVKAFKVSEHAPFRLPNESKGSVFAHHQTVTDQDKDNGPDTKVHQVLHDDVSGVFRAGKSCFHHGKSALHKENQNRTDQEPY